MTCVKISPSFWQRQRTFWHRQFAASVTSQQHTFDIIFGIIVPIICILIDPFVFHDSHLLGRWRLFAYLTGGIDIVILLLWLVAKHDFRLRIGAGAIAGMLLTGALFALIVGIVLFPFTLIGLIFLIGVLGFIPFLTAFVFARNSWRALRYARTYISRQSLLLTLFAGAFLLTVGGISFQIHAWLQRPEIQTLPIYPSAQHVHISDFEMTDSGFATEKTYRFDTPDSAAMVASFYHQTLLQAGWQPDNSPYTYTLKGDQHHTNATYTYEAASGQTYVVYIYVVTIGTAQPDVVLSLKRNGSLFD